MCVGGSTREVFKLSRYQALERREIDDQLWFSPFKPFGPGDHEELEGWRLHYRELGIRTRRVESGGSTLLFVSFADDQRVWPRELGQ